jgi:excisionase family DNA binding protein
MASERTRIVAPADDDGERFVTAADVADVLGMSVFWVHVNAKRGEIPSYLIGRNSRRFRLSEVRRWMETKHTGPSVPMTRGKA